MRSILSIACLTVVTVNVGFVATAGRAQDLLNDHIEFSSFHLELRPLISEMPNNDNDIISMTTRPGDPRLYVTTQEGRIYVVNQNPDGTGSPSTWFNVGAAVSLFGSRGQAGLQSTAFHPDFSNEGAPGYGKLYTTMLRSHPSNTAGLNYLGDSPRGFGSPDGVLAEWTYDHDIDQVDPSSFRELFRVKMPFLDHPIKQARFNPYARPGDEDYGLLYLTHGDSNEQHSPGDYPQLLGNALGKMLRINPLASGDHPYTIPPTNPLADIEDTNVLREIYAYGFRNPHTYSFNPDDEGNIHILVGDIGRANIEEIDLVVAGQNYGWPKREGTFVHRQNPNDTPNSGYISGVEDLPSSEAELGFTFPVAQYDHDAMVGERSSGNSVASGFVIRNGSNANLHNQLIISDFSRQDGDVYHADFEQMLNAVTRLDGDNPARDEPGELSQAPLHKLRLELDHDNNPTTSPQIFDNFLDLLNTSRTDVRFGEGVLGEMFISTKRNGGAIYLVTNSLPLSGDYNRNGVVDAADYTIWRDTLGESGFRLAADSNGNSTVDVEDYFVWRSAYTAALSAGRATASSAVVPEPSGLMLTFTLIVICRIASFPRSRRRRQTWRGF